MSNRSVNVRSRLFQIHETICQEVGGDSGKAVSQIGIAAAPANEQLANDEQAPAIADLIERFGKTAVLAVGTHASKLTSALEII